MNLSAVEEHGCADIGNDDDGWVYIECDCGARFNGLPDFPTAVDELLDHVAGGRRTTVTHLKSPEPVR